MKRIALYLVLALVFLEWLDFSLYLYLAKAIFAKEFFPQTAYSLTLTFALFATAYLARPVGGWLFGRKADNHGRRRPMIFSAALMGTATLGICLLPGYATWGIFSTWGLLILRVAQGLALGGEINTSAMFLIEHEQQKPLVTGSLAAASGALGMFVGGGIAAVVQTIAFPEAWRLIFAVVGLVSLWVCQKRKKLQESPEFSQFLAARKTEHSPAKAALRGKEVFSKLKIYWRGLANIALMGGYVSVMVYLCNVYWVAFASDLKLWSSIQCAWMGSLAQLASALLALPIAWVARPYLHRLLLKSSMIVIALAGPLLFYFTLKHLAWGVIIMLGGYILGNALLCSSLFYFLYLQLPVEYRCQGVSTVWALAAMLGACSLPIAEQMVAHQYRAFPGIFVGGTALIALLCFIFLDKQPLTHNTAFSYPQGLI